MAHGVSRAFRPSGPISFFARSVTSLPPTAESWAIERGRCLFSSTVDITGGFPGYCDLGGNLKNANLRITESYLLVDELLPHGFGLPLTWLDCAMLAPDAGHHAKLLRVFYRFRGMPRSFSIMFRGSRISLRGVSRAEQAHQSLSETGCAAVATPVRIEPSFSLPWEEARDFESENVIWTGRASAPIEIGLACAPSDIWLTTRSLIWGSGAGKGINRLPLPLLMDVVTTRVRDRTGTPAVYLSIGDETTGRYELPFVFGLHATPDRNFRERGAFLVGLRSRGLPDGFPAPPNQPWHAWTRDAFPDDESEAEQEPLLDDLEAAAEIEPVSDSGVGEDALGRYDAPLALYPDRDPDDGARTDSKIEPPSYPEWASVVETSVLSVLGDVVSLDHDAPARDEIVAERTESLPDGPEERLASQEDRVVEPAGLIRQALVFARSAPAPAPADSALETTLWSEISDYEALALETLTAAVRAVDVRCSGIESTPCDRHAPNSLEQARAISNLESLRSRGLLDPAIAAQRKQRLTVLGDVCVRLLTLIELHDGGFLSAVDLAERKTRLSDKLSVALTVPASRNGRERSASDLGW